MAYKVIRDFTDGNENSADDNGNLHVYHVGDVYPYQIYAGSQTGQRLDQLSSTDGPNENFDGPVIEKVEEGDD